MVQGKTRVKKLYFVRHGLTEMNVAGLFAGHTETPLTDEGRAQAKAAGTAAKQLGIDTIVSSPLNRAVETAQIMATEIGYPIERIHTNSVLIERYFGAQEGKPWAPDFNLDGISDAEHDDTLVARAKVALEWLKTFEGQTILVVSHGGFGRAMRSILRPDYPMTSYVQLKNAEIYDWNEK